MKKLRLMLVLQFLAAGLVMPSNAQVRLGVIGGLNLANFQFESGSFPGPSSFTTFGAGGVLQLRLAQSLSLQLEPMYLQKGARLKFSFQDSESDSGLFDFNVDAKFKLNYLEVPALVRLDIGAGETKPYLIAGPIIGFRSSAKLTGSASEAGVKQEYDEDIKNQTKGLDFGLGFGGGLSFPVGGNAILVQARYTHGLTDIYDDPEDPETKIKTRGIQLMTGIIF